MLELDRLIQEAADELASALRHYGPGAHPGTGTEQEVHAGGGRGQGKGYAAGHRLPVPDWAYTAWQAIGTPEWKERRADLEQRLVQRYPTAEPGTVEATSVTWIGPSGALIDPGGDHQASAMWLLDAPYSGATQEDIETSVVATNAIVNSGFIRVNAGDAGQVGFDLPFEADAVTDEQWAAMSALLTQNTNESASVPDTSITFGGPFREAGGAAKPRPGVTKFDLYDDQAWEQLDLDRETLNAIAAGEFSDTVGVDRHYGPGAHPGTGTEQEVHGGGRGAKAYPRGTPPPRAGIGGALAKALTSGPWEVISPDKVGDLFAGRGWLTPDGDFVWIGNTEHNLAASDAISRSGLKKPIDISAENFLKEAGFARMVLVDDNLFYDGPDLLTGGQARAINALLASRDGDIVADFPDMATMGVLSRERLEQMVEYGYRNEEAGWSAKKYPSRWMADTPPEIVSGLDKWTDTISEWWKDSLGYHPEIWEFTNDADYFHLESLSPIRRQRPDGVAYARAAADRMELNSMGAVDLRNRRVWVQDERPTGPVVGEDRWIQGVLHEMGHLETDLVADRAIRTMPQRVYMTLNALGYRDRDMRKEYAADLVAAHVYRLSGQADRYAFWRGDLGKFGREDYKNLNAVLRELNKPTVKASQRSLEDVVLVIYPRAGEAVIWPRTDETEPFIVRHYGPGPHPGTGTEQTVHAGDDGRAKDYPAGEPSAKWVTPALRELMGDEAAGQVAEDMKYVLTHGGPDPAWGRPGDSKMQYLLDEAVSFLRENIVASDVADMRKLFGGPKSDRWILRDGTEVEVVGHDESSLGAFRILGLTGRFGGLTGEPPRIDVGDSFESGMIALGAVRFSNNGGALGATFDADLKLSDEQAAVLLRLMPPPAGDETFVWEARRMATEMRGDPVEGVYHRLVASRAKDDYGLDSMLAYRHYGPGAHPGTGTEQEVHAGAEGREKKVKGRTHAGRGHYSEVAYAPMLLHGFKGRLFEKGTAQQADGWGNAQSRAAYDWMTGTDKEANRRERELERQIDRLTDRDGRALRGHGAEVADLRRQIEELETGWKYGVMRAVDDYVENTHRVINRRLRKGEVSDVLRFHIDSLDALMAKAVTSENVVAFRGVSDDFGKRLRAGRKFTDRAFVSTTIYENILKVVEEGGWGESQVYDWHLAVLVPAGTHAYYTGRRHGHGGATTKEYELLLDRGTTFKVLSVDRQSKTATIKVVDQRTHDE